MTFAEVDSKVKEIEKYLNESHIKHLIIENLEISREEDHGKLIHAAFSFNSIREIYGMDPVRI